MTCRAVLVAAVVTTLPGPLAAQSSERLYQEACDGGDMIACNVFGLMFEYGDGVARDAGRAAGLYERACEGGELVGCTNLGMMYQSGSGVTQDEARAVGLYRVACEGGELLGCDRLGAAAPSRALAPRYTKTGRVGNAETGEALSEALVEVIGLDQQVISDAEGRITLTGLPRGVHPLRADRLGYDPLYGQLEVPGNPGFFVLMTPAEVANIDDPGHIVGRVSEGASRGLADVEIAVLGQERVRTLSNQDGRFNLRAVEPGLVDVRFTRLGYAPRTATLVVQPDRTTEVAATMFIEPIELEPIQVTVRSSFLEQNGFYDRAAGGFGAHFTEAEIVSLVPNAASDVIRGRVSGVQVQYGANGEVRVTNRRRNRRGQPEIGPGAGAPDQGCVLSIWVDGIPTRGVDVDEVPPEQISAMEVYAGAEAPAQYSGNPCGAVLIWTRRGA